MSFIDYNELRDVTEEIYFSYYDDKFGMNYKDYKCSKIDVINAVTSYMIEIKDENLRYSIDDITEILNDVQNNIKEAKDSFDYNKLYETIEEIEEIKLTKDEKKLISENFEKFIRHYQDVTYTNVFSKLNVELLLNHLKKRKIL